MKISGVNIGSRLKHIFSLWSRVLTDNLWYIALVNNLVSHSQAKHIDIRHYLYMRISNTVKLNSIIYLLRICLQIFSPRLFPGKPLRNFIPN